MKVKPLPILPKDEMSLGVRVNVTKVLTSTFKPANSENMSLFCDCCDNLNSLLGAMVKENTAFLGHESPENLFYDYSYLLNNIRRFNRANMEMVASQYVSLSEDYQPEMNIRLTVLNGSILDFMALPINQNPDVVVPLLLKEFESTTDIACSQEGYKPLLNIDFNKEIPLLIHHVNKELEPLLLKHQELHAVCRGHRSDMELGLIFRTEHDRYYEEEFPKQRMEEEAYILQRMNDTGEKRHTVLQDRYDKISTDFLKTTEGHIHYSNHGSEIEVVKDMVRMNTNSLGYTAYFGAICKMEHLTHEIEHQSREDELNAYREKDQKKTKKVTFTSSQNEKMVMLHIHDAIDFLTQKKSKPQEWVCLYQALLFYKLILPVHFLDFYRWINDLVGKEIFSYDSAKKAGHTYFGKEAGKVWTEHQATKYKDTEKMENKVESYNLLVTELFNILRFGRL